MKSPKKSKPFSPSVKRAIPNKSNPITMHNYSKIPTFTESKAKRLVKDLVKDGYIAHAEKISTNVWVIRRN